MLQENHWMRRTKFLTQALIISGTLNIGLIATFAYFTFKEKQDALSQSQKPASQTTLTNAQLLKSYSLLPYQELLLRLENKDLLEEGLAKRDLALACLVAFHHFNLDKALGGLPLQKRMIPFANEEGQETIDVPVFPGLADYQFHAIVQYAKMEKWPLTSQGLFYELKRSPPPRDPSLLDAFYLSGEYYAAYTLLAKTGMNIPREQLVDLICEGEWQPLADLAIEQRTSLDLTPDRRRLFLLDYLGHHSRIAAILLLEADSDFVLRRLSDEQILTLLDLYPNQNALLENLAKELLASPRTDTVHKQASAILYTLAGEVSPETYDHQVALNRFLPPKPLTPPPPAPQASIPVKKYHLIEPGENLWKIARKYKVTIEEIKRANNMESDKLRPGKKLQIPERQQIKQEEPSS